jgi:hypothetical protein
MRNIYATLLFLCCSVCVTSPTYIHTSYMLRSCGMVCVAENAPFRSKVHSSARYVERIRTPHNPAGSNGVTVYFQESYVYCNCIYGVYRLIYRIRGLRRVSSTHNFIVILLVLRLILACNVCVFFVCWRQLYITILRKGICIYISLMQYVPVHILCNRLRLSLCVYNVSFLGEYVYCY